MRPRVSFGSALVLALMLHASAVLVSSQFASRIPRRARPDLPAPLFDIELPVEPPPEARADVPNARAPETHAQPSEAKSVAARAATASNAPALAASSVVTAEPESTATTPWTIHVTSDAAATNGAAGGALGKLALDGQNHFMGTRETAAEAARAEREQANQAAGAAMREALHAHDTAIGLGGGGPVVTAMESVVRESLAPVDSHAILVAIADESGTELRVDIESSTDAAAFREVADDVLKRLRSQKVRVPAGSHGLAMRIDIASKMARPSGGGVGLDPKDIGGHFDIVDLGAKPRRVIHARVLAEQVL